MPEEKKERESKHLVRIHIDRAPYETDNPSTGAKLYELGGVGKPLELFRELEGDEEDVLVPRDDKSIRLKEDEHFYSRKDFHIIVNAQKKVVTKNVQSYHDIVVLAFGQEVPGTVYTITYRKGPRRNPEGSLLPGQSVKIKDGMVFNVTATNQS